MCMAEQGSAVVNFILVMVGGGLGAILREFFMLKVPNLVDGFPLDILVANLLASFLLGLVTGLHRRQVLSDNVSMLQSPFVLALSSEFTKISARNDAPMWSKPDMNKAENRRQALKGIGLGLAAGSTGDLGGEQVPTAMLSSYLSQVFPLHRLRRCLVHDKEWLIDIARTNLRR
jgi:hypothetical protein